MDKVSVISTEPYGDEGVAVLVEVPSVYMSCPSYFARVIIRPNTLHIDTFETREDLINDVNHKGNNGIAMKKLDPKY